MRRTARSNCGSSLSWKISARAPRWTIIRRSANGWRRRKISRNRGSQIHHQEESAMQTQTYLFFDGRTEEALEFYKKALGGEVEWLTVFKDIPADPNAASDPNCPAPRNPNGVMHCSFKLAGQQIMASDGD